MIDFVSGIVIGSVITLLCFKRYYEARYTQSLTNLRRVLGK